MTFLDDDRPTPKPAARPGESLADLSIAELQERIVLYRGEVARLEQEIARKQESLQAAAAFFR